MVGYLSHMRSYQISVFFPVKAEGGIRRDSMVCNIHPTDKDSQPVRRISTIVMYLIMLLFLLIKI